MQEREWRGRWDGGGAMPVSGLAKLQRAPQIQIALISPKTAFPQPSGAPDGFL